MAIKHLKTELAFAIMNLPMKGQWRKHFAAWGGVNTIISKPVCVGDGAIIGSGSVVTKYIPANEIWAGNPAKFMKEENYL